MFEKIVLRRSENGETITLGEVAQAMLFYKNVHLILDRTTVLYFVKALGAKAVLSLLSRHGVTAIYIEEELSVHNISLIYNHFDFSAITVMGDQSGVSLKRPEDRLAVQLVSFNQISKSEATSFTHKFFNIVRHRSYLSDYFVTGGVLKAAMSELSDSSLLHESIRKVFEHVTESKEIGSFGFEFSQTKQGFTINTDLNFTKLIEKACISKATADFKLQNILLELLIAKVDTNMAAFYNGDIYTSSLATDIITIRQKALLNKVIKEIENIKLFEEVIIKEAAPVKALLNKGHRTFDEFLTLLDKSDKFRSWAQDIDNDKKLVTEYLTDINKISWIEKSSTKNLRFLIATTWGFLEPISGTAVSAIDAFYLEKVIKGWRPNHFVEKEVSAFSSFT